MKPNDIIDTVLRVANVVAKLPGFDGARGAVAIANDVAPAIEDALVYFQTEEGKRAIAKVVAVVGAITRNMPKPTHQDAPKAQVANGHYELVEWDPFKGGTWRWVEGK